MSNSCSNNLRKSVQQHGVVVSQEYTRLPHSSRSDQNDLCCSTANVPSNKETVTTTSFPFIFLSKHVGGP